MIVTWRSKNYTFTPRSLVAEKDREGKGAKVTIDGNIYGFDTESVALPDRYEPQCFQVSSSFDGEDLRYLTPKARGLEDFLEFFIRKYSWIELERHYCFMYGHNLVYDWLQLIKFFPDLIAIARTGVGLTTDYDIYKNPDYKVVLRKGGLFTGSAPHFAVQVYFSKREWFDLMFRDTFSFFPTSLDKLGKDLKLSVKKQERQDDIGKVDFRTMDPCDKKSYFEEYAKIDSKVTRLAGEAIRELHVHAEMKRIRVSAPGFAINYLFHMIPEGTELITGDSDPSIMQLVLDTYAGGRTGGIYHGKVSNISVLDFHSSYPASFVTLPSFLPTMAYVRHPDPESITPEDLLAVIKESHCFVRISGEETDAQYPTLITSRKGKLTPVYGKFENLPTTGVELCVGMASGSLRVDKIHDLVLLIETEEPALLPFKIYAETAYQEKANAEKGSVLYTSAKLKLNSSYGKLIESRTETPVGDDVGNIVLPYLEGMETKFAKNYYEAYIGTLNEESTDNFLSVYPDIVEEIVNEFGEDDLLYTTFKNLSLTDLTYGRYAIPAAASLTTGTSRARLLAFVKCTHSIYWDTDSGFIRNLDKAKLPEQFALGTSWLPDFIQGLSIGEGLGELDLEIENASGYLAGVKRYYLSNPDGKYKKALHGIPTAPFDQAESMIYKLATGSNNVYEGKARPTGVKETKEVKEIGRFNQKQYESQFHLDERLIWEKDESGWRGSVRDISEMEDKT